MTLVTWHWFEVPQSSKVQGCIQFQRCGISNIGMHVLHSEFQTRNSLEYPPKFSTPGPINQSAKISTPLSLPSKWNINGGCIFSRIANII